MKTKGETEMGGKRGLVPTMRFPEFRHAGVWDEKTIGEVLKETPRPIDMKDESDYSLVTVKRRYGGVVSRGVLKGKAIKVKSQFLLQENDFIISKRQIVHCACGLVPENLTGSIVSNEYSVLRAKKNHDILFFNYFSQQFKVSQSFLECSIGIVIEKMLFKLPDWFKKKFLFPPLKEQQKIADCLSSLDELIAAQAHKLDTLKAHKKGLMQQLFPAPGQTTPTIRFPEFRDTGEWQEKSLGGLAKIITGNTPKTADPNNYGGERLFVSPADISDHRYISSTKTNLSDQGFENTREVPPKSILFVCIGSTIGKVAQNICECATNQQINSVIPFKEYSNDFIYSLLEKNSGEIAALAGKQAVPIINKTLFSSITLSCPSLPEQQKIADCFSSLDELIAAQANKLETLKVHKKGLMQQLFPNPDEANG
ncbi:restriction endonuclease subunit S [Desulfobacter sp. UBA2225]|uniref:restriction endonuclease subunit S n=1 Tax=Desulfobacter sp. UBA2225 TaxID=1961413 RepID=UPI00257A5380|nr:restriction endonuclease subunit S [Desulfobacter sp. UBA2225]